MGSTHSRHGAIHRVNSCGMPLHKKNATSWYLLECQVAVPAQMLAVAEMAAGWAQMGVELGSEVAV